jgi:hypothetical protein
VGSGEMKSNVDTDFIEEKYVPWLHETHAELDPSSFAVGYLVHAPVKIDVEDIKQIIASLLVSVAADRVEKGRYGNVTAHDWIGSPGRGD